MLTLKLGQANIPLIVTNHTYDVIGSYVPTKEMGGGSSGSNMPRLRSFISAKKRKRIRQKLLETLLKARRLNQDSQKKTKEVNIRLYYDERGLDRYYGLLELGELGGMWKNVAGRYEINGKKIYGKEILKNPTEYFTDDIMEKLDQISKEHFSYGKN